MTRCIYDIWQNNKVFTTIYSFDRQWRQYYCEKFRFCSYYHALFRKSRDTCKREVLTMTREEA